VGSPLSGTYTLPSTVASNGRAQLSITVNSVTYTYILYLDAANDGNVLETGGDSTVSFGFFTGQASTSKFNNTHISGTYAAGTSMPVLPTVPNLATPVTLNPSSTVPNSGTFSAAAGSVTGSYSFDSTTGRGTATANSGQLFQSSKSVFYIINPNLIILMGADSSVTSDAIGYMQF
jgi:hypothetical protein